MKLLLIIALALSNPPVATLTWSGQATQVWEAQGNCWNAAKLAWKKDAQIPPGSTYTVTDMKANTMYCFQVKDEAGHASNYRGGEVVVVP